MSGGLRRAWPKQVANNADTYGVMAAGMRLPGSKYMLDENDASAGGLVYDANMVDRVVAKVKRLFIG